jgi:hypothetical protein
VQRLRVRHNFKNITLVRSQAKKAIGLSKKSTILVRLTIDLFFPNFQIKKGKGLCGNAKISAIHKEIKSLKRSLACQYDIKIANFLQIFSKENNKSDGSILWLEC